MTVIDRVFQDLSLKEIQLLEIILLLIQFVSNQTFEMIISYRIISKWNLILLFRDFRLYTIKI